MLISLLPFFGIAFNSCNNAPKLSSGIDLARLDTSVRPGNDFYQFACGGWISAHPLADEYSRYGTFEELSENNTKQLQDLILEMASSMHKKGTLEQKIGDLYNIAMDSVKQNEDGFGPIVNDLSEISAVSSSSDIMKTMGMLARKGVPGYFGFYFDADIKNSDMNLLQIHQAGLTLGEREYYLESDSSTVAIRDAFRNFVTEMFVLCGFSEDDARKKTEAVLHIETRIAVPSYSATLRRDNEANYHKMSYSQLKKQFSGIDWDAYFGAMFINDIKEVNVAQPEPIGEIAKIILEEPLQDQLSYMQWRLIDAASPFLSDTLRACRFNFYGQTLSGKIEDRPRWKKAVSSVEGVLGEGLGKLYVDRYFPESSKQRMQKLVANLQEALSERIKVQEWMSDETKEIALDKLSSFYAKIGYPDSWRDFSGLEIIDDSYWANIVRSNIFDLDYIVAKKLNKPVDRDEWYMTPQTVNAYFNPSTNEICFPAGILQPPFFDPSADDACNYGGIGVVIGHEMTHGFDDQGRHFDRFGNLTDWWLPTDNEQFNERSCVMKEYFDAIEVLPGEHANGALTLGENLADHGGLMVSFQALKKAMKDQSLPVKDGFTPEQRFFLSYAYLWAGNVRDEQIRLLTKSDPHALGRWRVNGALPHIDAWYQAFGITENDAMFLPKEQRVDIW